MMVIDKELLRQESFKSIIINAYDIINDTDNVKYNRNEIEKSIKDFEETEEYEKCGKLLKVLNQLKS
jgi:hypothetical protein